MKGHIIKNAPYKMEDNFPDLYKTTNSILLVPIQESLVADLPPSSVDQAMHQPFPVEAPTIKSMLVYVFTAVFALTAAPDAQASKTISQ